MPRRPAEITQASVARIIRAAKQAGAHQVTIHVGPKAKAVIQLEPSTAAEGPLEDTGEIVL
jgi:pyridoxine 5'-phosphate synthase PdxJ